MAELLAIPAGAIAFGQAADRLGGILSKAGRLLEAPEEVSYLCNEVNRWKVMLEDIMAGRQRRHDALGIDDPDSLQASASACEKLIQVAQDLLDKKLVKASAANTGNEPEARRFQWAKKKGKVEKLRQRISYEMQIMILTHHTQFDRSLATRLDVHHEMLLQMSQSLKNLEQGMSVIALNKTDSPMQLSYRNPHRGKHTAEIFDRSPASAPLQRAVERNTNIVKVSAEGAQGCFNCPCRCHSSFSLTTGAWCPRVLGSLSIYGSSSLIALHSARICGCAQRGFSRISISYIPPLWFASRVALLRLMINPSPMFSLLLPKVLGPDADFFKYIQAGQVDMVSSMLQRGLAAPDLYVALGDDTVSALLFAFSEGEFEICRLLISWGADPRAREVGRYWWLPSSSVSENAWLLSFTRLVVTVGTAIEPVIDIESQGLTRLHKVINGMEHGCIDAAIAACYSEIDTVDCRGWSALHWAAWTGNELGMRHLLHAGARTDLPDNIQNWPIHYCALRGGSHACLVALLEAGCNPDPRSSRSENLQGSTPLHYAALNGRLDAAQSLLATGVDRDAQGDDKSTPLMIAVRERRNAFVGLLLTYKPDLELCDEDGDTALMNALIANNHGAFEQLTTSGARLDVTNFRSRSVLHLVAARGDIRMIRLLTKYDLHGINPDGLDTSGHTAIQRLKARDDCSSELLRAFEQLVQAAWRCKDTSRPYIRRAWEIEDSVEVCNGGNDGFDRKSVSDSDIVAPEDIVEVFHDARE